MNFRTADLCDQHPDDVKVAEPLFRDFGGVTTFAGEINTLDVYEDYALVEELLQTPGAGRVLVVDGGGSVNAALFGGDMAQLAAHNGWAGVIVNGCIRDAEEVARVPLGVKALHAVPRAGRKEGRGKRNRPARFAGVTFRPGHYIYADADGIVVAKRDLLAPE